MTSPFVRAMFWAIKRDEPRGASNTSPALTKNPNVGGSGMAAKPNILPNQIGSSAFRALPGADELHRIFKYDPGTGLLTYRRRTPEEFSASTSPERSAAHFNRTFAGKPAMTCRNRYGYHVGRVGKQQCLAHRVAWKMYYGTDPLVVDHINGDRADNRISNLRSGTHQQNSRNARLRSDNKTGISGIWRKAPKKWGAAWLFVEAEGGVISSQKSFKCFGLAVRHRNEVLRAGDYRPDHGIRGFEHAGSIDDRHPQKSKSEIGGQK